MTSRKIWLSIFLCLLFSAGAFAASAKLCINPTDTDKDGVIDCQKTFETGAGAISFIDLTLGAPLKVRLSFAPTGGNAVTFDAFADSIFQEFSGKDGSKAIKIAVSRIDASIPSVELVYELISGPTPAPCSPKSKCSSTPPLYCNENGVLVVNPIICPCPEGWSYDASGQQCVLSQACSDGTPLGQCSLASRGFECVRSSDGSGKMELFFNPEKCGCPKGVFDPARKECVVQGEVVPSPSAPISPSPTQSGISLAPFIPMAFYGTVKIEGVPAPYGTVVSVKVSNEVKGSLFVYEEGVFGCRGIVCDKLLVFASRGESGKELSFFVNGFSASGEEAGASEKLSVSEGLVQEIDLNCQTGACGDGVCSEEERESGSCPEDCAQPTATGSPTPTSSPTATGSPTPTSIPECGDGKCISPENCASCPEDCGDCGDEEGRCGDGVCQRSRGESCSTCPQDCGQCGDDDDDHQSRDDGSSEKTTPTAAPTPTPKQTAQDRAEFSESKKPLRFKFEVPKGFVKPNDLVAVRLLDASTNAPQEGYKIAMTNPKGQNYLLGPTDSDGKVSFTTKVEGTYRIDTDGSYAIEKAEVIRCWSGEGTVPPDFESGAGTEIASKSGIEILDLLLLLILLLIICGLGYYYYKQKKEGESGPAGPT